MDINLNSGSKIGLVLSESSDSEKEISSDQLVEQLEQVDMDENSCYAINEEKLIFEINQDNGISENESVDLLEKTNVAEEIIIPLNQTEIESANTKQLNFIAKDFNESTLILKTNAIKKDYSRQPQANKIINNKSLASKFFMKMPCKINDPAEAVTHKCEKCAFMCDIKGCGFSTKFKNAFDSHKAKQHIAKRPPIKEVLNSNKKLKEDDKLPSDEPTIFACQYCPFKSEKYVLFVSHMKGKSMLKTDYLHPKSDVIVCGVKDCTFLTQDRDLFIKHKQDKGHDVGNDQVENDVDNKPIFVKNNQEYYVGQKDIKIQYSCKYCSAKFDNMNACKNHVWTHENKALCEICNLKFNSYHEYVKHKSLHERTFKCMNGVCTFRAPALDDIKEHMKKCPFGVSCRHCKYRAVSLVDLRKHEATHMSFNMTCNFCYLQFATKEEILNHYTNQHRAAFSCIVYNCKYCWFKSTGILDVIRHFTESHKATLTIYECPVCSVQTEMLEEYQIHFLQHMKC